MAAVTLDSYKLSCELLGHSMDIRAVAPGASAPEGQVILSGSRDKTVKVWKRSGDEYLESVTLQDHKNFIACVFYLENERWICTGSNDSTVCIYQEGGFVPILVLKGHESTVCSIAAGIKPMSIITGSWDKTARVWTIDQMGGFKFITLQGHEAAVWAVASMPAVEKFITGSADKTIYYWNSKGEKLRMLKGHTDCIRGILSLGSSSLVSCANDAIIRYWNEDGECVQEMSGHTNYIYAIAQNKALGEEYIVSCGEDSTLRMWNLASGLEQGSPIVHPAQSVWTVACLKNGDIVTGCSDGVVRVFTKDPTRVANATTLNAFNLAVTARKEQINEDLGGVKKTDLAGPESLLINGTQDGQSKMVRHPDGSVKCYTWEQGKWNLIGDVTGASGGSQASSGKTLHEGKEYDFVFSVDISDSEPPIKLPYNRGEDPWHAAQEFIHKNGLPQAYLDQVANFIVKNSSGSAAVRTEPASSGYHDPFTGGSRYVPGASNNNLNQTGNVDPFTGGSSYSTSASRQQPKIDVNFVKENTMAAVTLDSYKLSCELLGHSMDIRAVAPGTSAPEGQVILSGSRDKTVKVWKRSGDEYLESVTLQDHKNFIACVFYLENERWICTGSNDSTVCIYQEGGFVPILVLKGHESTVCSIAAGIKPMSIITGSWDKTARVWTIDQMGGFKFITLQGHEAAVWAVASMPAVEKFITGSADKTIYYWNSKGEKLRMLKGHTDCIRGILSLGSSSLVSCANDAIIRYWNEDGECVQEMSGHTNYIYAIAQNKALGEEYIVSCGEDSTLRMWNLASGLEQGSPIVHPAQSVWTVACLKNGDIVTGCSDGVVRVFTKDPTRVANATTLNAFNLAVTARKEQINEDLGGVKKTDLAGPESLLINGTQDGQSKMVRHPDGSVKCYTWEQGKWNLIGDVTGASGGSQASSGKTLHEGKEYDFVFSVDISDSEPPIKLPYNRGEDPWHAAQEFIHKNGLPQAYLDQVANFIVKNSSGSAAVRTEPASSGYHDPFTGGSRYVPGASNNNLNQTGNVDPFTGGSSYSTSASRQQPKIDVNFVKGSEKHFPVSNYVTFDNCDSCKVLDKLKEFNNKLPETNAKVSEILLEAVIKLTESEPEIDKNAIEALQHLLRWPNDVLFPVLDVTRLAVRTEALFSMLNSFNFLDTILPKITSSVPNQLMIVRCLGNMMAHDAGREQVEKRLTMLVEQIIAIKSGSANLQIAIATFYLNLTISQTLGVSNGDKCRILTEGIIELLKWAVDLEACYRSMQAIGNLVTTPFGQETAAQVISVDYVMDKIRELANTPQTGALAKLNAAGTELLAAF